MSRVSRTHIGAVVGLLIGCVSSALALIAALLIVLSLSLIPAPPGRVFARFDWGLSGGQWDAIRLSILVLGIVGISLSIIGLLLSQRRSVAILGIVSNVLPITIFLLLCVSGAVWIPDSERVEIVLTGPPALPAPQSITIARWRTLGTDEDWTSLPADQASAILAVLATAESWERKDGKPRKIMMAGLDREIQFISNDNREYSVLLRHDNAVFWCGERTIGRKALPKEYRFDHDLSQKELTTFPRVMEDDRD